MTESEAILSMEVPIIVQLGERQMPLSEVADWAPGTIIELPKRVEEELSLLVSNKPIGQGTAVKIGENFGIRISFIGDVRARLTAATTFTLGSDSDSFDGDLSEINAEQTLTGQL